MNDIQQLTKEEWAEIKTSREMRKKLTGESLYWFFHIYFSHYVKYPTAAFQREIMELASDPDIEQLIICAFRESGKSTIITTALPLWSIVGKMEKKFVVICSQSQTLARQHLANIVNELESNDLIRKDFWPYDYEQNETGVTAINLPKYGARIIAVSKEQGVRGIRHGEHRPDLIIADDIEDSRSVKTQESRNATFQWYTSEILPLGSEATKFITVGNLLHEDSLIMRLKEGIENGERSGAFKFYPIENSEEIPLWIERFPDHEAIKKLEMRIADPIRFEKEYRLRIVADEDQIICRDDIHYYDADKPFPDDAARISAMVGIDLAISQKTSADYTAMIMIFEQIDLDGNVICQQIAPILFNERVSFTETVEKIRSMRNLACRPKFYVETVGYQEAILHALEDDMINIEGYVPNIDKRGRLNLIAHKIKTGKIQFPLKGAEELITQLVGFGIEKHDDLVDALTCAIIMADRVDHAPVRPEIIMGSARGTPFERRGFSSESSSGFSGYSVQSDGNGGWNWR